MDAVAASAVSDTSGGYRDDGRGCIRFYGHVYQQTHTQTEAPTLEAVSVTHHSVELAWRVPSHHGQAQRPHYTVQEEEAGKGRGFSNIYR